MPNCEHFFLRNKEKIFLFGLPFNYKNTIKKKKFNFSKKCIFLLNNKLKLIRKKKSFSYILSNSKRKIGKIKINSENFKLKKFLKIKRLLGGFKNFFHRSCFRNTKRVFEILYFFFYFFSFIYYLPYVLFCLFQSGNCLA